MAHQHQTCIDACVRAALECERCAVACLDEGIAEHRAECIRLDHDCAAICFAAAGFMSRGSRFMDDICRICAAVCMACADECGRYQDEHCQHCSQACRRCADECGRMSGVAA